MVKLLKLSVLFCALVLSVKTEDIRRDDSKNNNPRIFNAIGSENMRKSRETNENFDGKLGLGPRFSPENEENLQRQWGRKTGLDKNLVTRDGLNKSDEDDGRINEERVADRHREKFNRPINANQERGNDRHEKVRGRDNKSRFNIKTENLNPEFLNKQHEKLRRMNEDRPENVNRGRNDHRLEEDRRGRFLNEESRLEEHFRDSRFGQNIEFSRRFNENNPRNGLDNCSLNRENRHKFKKLPMEQVEKFGKINHERIEERQNGRLQRPEEATQERNTEDRRSKIEEGDAHHRLNPEFLNKQHEKLRRVNEDRPENINQGRNDHRLEEDRRGRFLNEESRLEEHFKDSRFGQNTEFRRRFNENNPRNGLNDSLNRENRHKFNKLPEQDEKLGKINHEKIEERQNGRLQRPEETTQERNTEDRRSKIEEGDAHHRFNPEFLNKQHEKLRRLNEDRPENINQGRNDHRLEEDRRGRFLNEESRLEEYFRDSRFGQNTEFSRRFNENNQRIGLDDSLNRNNRHKFNKLTMEQTEKFGKINHERIEERQNGRLQRPEETTQERNTKDSRSKIEEGDVHHRFNPDFLNKQHEKLRRVNEDRPENINQGRNDHRLEEDRRGRFLNEESRLEEHFKDSRFGQNTEFRRRFNENNQRNGLDNSLNRDNRHKFNKLPKQDEKLVKINHEKIEERQNGRLQRPEETTQERSTEDRRSKIAHHRINSEFLNKQRKITKRD